MKKIFIVLEIIIVCSALVGIFDRAEQKRRERIAVKEKQNIHIPYGVYEKYFKRSLDFFFSLIALIVLSPMLVVTYLAVQIKLGSPVLFTQERSSKDQKVFQIFKFRTMTDERDSQGNLLPDEVRLTNFGKRLRSSSIDELPELINIIRSDMSIIGPRPLPESYNIFFTDLEKKRFGVRSGLIPPDSAETSAYITWDKQLECEAKYASAVTLKNDFKIFLKSLLMVLRRNNADYGGYVRKTLTEERANGTE